MTAHTASGKLVMVVCVHVDDLLIAAGEDSKQAVQAIKQLFPFGDWRSTPFTFCGKEVSRGDDGTLYVGQESFAQALEPLDLSKARRAQQTEPATSAEIADNRSALGALGWLSTQTRADLSAGVSLSQRAQHAPLVADLLETDKLIGQARNHASAQLIVPQLTGDLSIVVFHDASWANAEETSAVFTTSKDPAASAKKPPRLKTRSQAGYIVFVTERSIETSGAARCMVADWRSAAIRRVCRSTFAAETMSAVDALGAAQVLRATLVWSLFPGSAASDPDPQLCPIRCVTDCASLYDTIHREGSVKLPAERRLVLDLIGFREGLAEEIAHLVIGVAEASKLPLSWVPTAEQLGDGLTKRSTGERLRTALSSGRVAIREQEPTPDMMESFLTAWIGVWSRVA